MFYPASLQALTMTLVRKYQTKKADFLKIILSEIELGTECIGECQKGYMDCYKGCGVDLNCMSECSRVLASCNDGK